MSKVKFEEYSTYELLYSGPLTGQKVGDDTDKVGCYMIDSGSLLRKVAPKLPSDGNDIKFSFALAVQLSNELVAAIKVAVEKCSGKRLVIPKPGGIFSIVPVLLKQFLGIDWWD